MAKQPFTPDGVKLKVTELYALTDADLNVQVQQINTQFTTWVNTNFDLTDDQGDYLTGMSGPYLSNFSGTITIALGNRIPITYTGPDEPPVGGSGSKRFETKLFFSHVIDHSNEETPTGSLEIIATYPED